MNKSHVIIVGKPRSYQNIAQEGMFPPPPNFQSNEENKNATERCLSQTSLGYSS